jgi:Ca2+-binding EF-hand superfamily protein
VQQRQAEMRSAFESFDEDKNGEIDPTELFHVGVLEKV